jgi:hypothetical protein
MFIRHIPATLAALAAAACCVAVPVANAAPNPGDQCSTPVGGDGPMWCDMQAGIWISSGPAAVVGQPCSTPGDVRLANGENLAHCAQGVWIAGSR